MSNPSDEQIQKLIKALKTAKRNEVETKSGFLKFLKNIGMKSFANKLANSPMWDQVWSAVQSFFDAIGNAVTWAIDKIVDAFTELWE